MPLLCIFNSLCLIYSVKVIISRIIAANQGHEAGLMQKCAGNCSKNYTQKLWICLLSYGIQVKDFDVQCSMTRGERERERKMVQKYRTIRVIMSTQESLSIALHVSSSSAIYNFNCQKTKFRNFCLNRHLSIYNVCNRNITLYTY